MKKYLILFLIFCLLLTAFTGCGRTQSLSRYTTVMHRDIPIALNAPAAPILAALGAPFGYGESKSGVYRGVEKTYEFTGLRVKTFQSGDEERILGVMITCKPPTASPSGTQLPALRNALVQMPSKMTAVWSTAAKSGWWCCWSTM